MTTAPKITALAPWFGGKRTMAPLICAEQVAPEILLINGPSLTGGKEQP